MWPEICFDDVEKGHLRFIQNPCPFERKKQSQPKLYLWFGVFVRKLIVVVLLFKRKKISETDPSIIVNTCCCINGSIFHITIFVNFWLLYWEKSKNIETQYLFDRLVYYKSSKNIVSLSLSLSLCVCTLMCVYSFILSIEPRIFLIKVVTSASETWIWIMTLYRF